MLFKQRLHLLMKILLVRNNESDERALSSIPNNSNKTKVISQPISRPWRRNSISVLEPTILNIAIDLEGQLRYKI